jgi:transposase InsO family protein
MKPRKKYSKEFKLDAVSLVLEQGYSRIEAARSLGIGAPLIGRWVKEYQDDDDGQAFRGNGKPAAGLIVHSDRGSQYASKVYRQLLKMHSFIGSMSRKGNCWDNSVAESFFGSMKQERVQWKSYQTRYEAHKDVLNYISMFYNCNRLHSYIGYRSPMQFELDMLELRKVA